MSSSPLVQAEKPSVSGASSQFVVKEGWLVKQGGKYKTWKKRWFVLKNNHISYHKDPTKEPVGVITFSIVSSISVAPDWDKKSNKHRHFRINVTDGRSGGAFLIAATNVEEMQLWITAIREALEKYRRAGVGTNAIGSDTKEVKQEQVVEIETKKVSIQSESSHENVKRRMTMDLRKPPHLTPGSRISCPKLPGDILSRKVQESFSDDEDSDDDGENPEMQMSDEVKSKELYYAVVTGNIVSVKAWFQLGVDTDWLNPNENNRTALHAAVQLNDERVVNDLLSYGCSVNIQDTQGTAPIHIAAAHGNIKSLDALLSRPEIDLSLLDTNNRSSTYIAVFSGHKECSERLLAREIEKEESLWSQMHLSALHNDELSETVDASSRFPCGVTPLHVAAAFNSCNTIKHILEKSPRVPLKDHLQRTPLHYAAASGALEATILLIESGFDLNAREVENKTPLHFAAGLNRLPIVQELLNRECIIAKDNREFSPLHIACVYGHPECVSELLKGPVDVNKESMDDYTPLFLAAHSGDTETISILLEHRANINTRVLNNLTPVHEACRRGNSSALRLLIDNKANIEAIDDQGNSPLLTAIRANSNLCTLMLLEAGADLEIRNSAKESPLGIAVDVENFDIVYTLLEQGVDCNDISMGVTALFTAAAKGNKPIVKLLLEFGAVVDAMDRWKTTPLLRAVSAGHSDIVEILIEAGANPNHKTKTFISPLLDAAANDRVECLEILLAAGALTTCCNQQKSTPLHEAAAIGSVRCMSRLILFGASLSARDGQGFTPMHVAAINGKSAAVLLCIAHGAVTPGAVDMTIIDLVDAVVKDTKRGKERKRRKDRKEKKGKKESSLKRSYTAPESPVFKKEPKVPPIVPPFEIPKEAAPTPPTTGGDQPEMVESNEPESTEPQKEKVYPPLPVPPGEPAAALPTPENSEEKSITEEADDVDIQIAKEYIKRAQKILSKPDYKRFHKLLLEYKQETISQENLFEQISLLLNTPDTLDLLENFKTFLPDDQKDAYSSYVSKTINPQ